MEQRRREAAEALRRHSLFGFQVHDAAVRARLRELRELLLATCGERDQIALLGETVRELEDALRAHSERFLLEPLRRFEQEMELLLDVASDEPLDGDSASDAESDEPERGSPEPPLPPEEEVLCGVCCAPDSLETDPIVICDVCGVAVHQTCYRLAAVPDGDWYCHPCRRFLDADSLVPTHEIECQACCSKAGALAPTADGGWVHVACSMFLPELFLKDQRTLGAPDDLQVVCGVDKLKPRRKLRCCFCRKSNEKGACAQCAVGKCVVAYHALCALRNGIKLRYMEDKDQFGSGCLKHQAKFLNMEDDREAEDAVKKHAVKTGTDKSKAKRSRRKSWSDEDDSESDDEHEDDHELDSDSEQEGSQDSLSDDDQDEKAVKKKKHVQASPTKMSPPRLLGGPPLRKSGGKQTNRSRRSRQIKLSFASAEDAPKPSPKAGPASANSAPSNSVPRGPAQQIVPADTARNNETNCRVVLQTNVFAPVFYPEAYKPDRNDRDFEYVMVLISSRPLGLGIASSNKCPGIFLLARTTVNPAVVAALDRDVIQNGDEIFAFNDLVLRNSTVKIFTEEVVPSVTLPVRCWFRTKRKSKIFSAASSELVSVGADAPARTSGKRLPSVEKVTSLDTHNYSMTVPGEKPRDTEGGVVSLGIDWPWVFLRSDGKLAMNLFWKSLDSAFFVKKLNKRTFSQLQEKLEDMCGVRLNSSHPEYEQVRELLVMPRRERVPSYLVEFRKTRMEKQHFLSSDIFMGVSSESKDVGGEVDEQTPLEVGTTVTVAKRTWPGMNKLGGAGRIRKVNEKTLPDGTKRFTYNVALVLGGYDNNVERKYISVVDLEAEESEQHEESTTGRRHKSEKNDPEPDVKDATDEDTSITSVRLSFSLLRTEDDDKLAALPDAVIDGPPKKRRFQLQFSTANSAVYCERKNIDGAPAKEMLLHRHFDVKLPETDALTNACFSSQLLDIEDRVGDEVDEDDTDSEGEVDEIKTELATLQSQFRAVMEKNEQAFVSLTKKVEEEYASKGYRQWEIQDIEWRNYERMYQEMQAAKRQFEDSDDESDDDEDGRVPGSGAGKRRKPESEVEESEPEDVSFGGMFVNKLKQEGNEVCALCELSGGDFTGTDTGDVVHPQCAMFTPETFFKDGVVYGVNLVDPERRRLKCSICGGRKGLSKIQCAHRKCVQAYHVACAFVNGLLISDPYYQAWCPRHLKTSGLGQFVDLPAHMNKDRSAIATNDTPGTTPASSPARRNRKNSRPRSRQKKSSSRQDTTPAEPTTVARAEISSSKTNRKRKRKGSNAGATATASNVRNAAHGNRGSSPRNNAAVEGPEPRCARRLEIELSDDSDHEGKAVGAWQQGRDQQLVFAKNDVVEVLTRDWRGINKPGGVARVRAVSLVPNDNGGKDVFYDVNYVMGTYKEKRVPARFVRSYNQGDAE